MSIEKLNKDKFILTSVNEHYLFTKINEIIDKLNSQYIENLCHRLKEVEKDNKEKMDLDEVAIDLNNLKTEVKVAINTFEYRLHDLEIHSQGEGESLSDKDDGLIAKEGTFEWALIMMKNGKKVTGGNKIVKIFIKPIENIILAVKCINPLLAHEFKITHQDVLATDWELVD